MSKKIFTLILLLVFTMSTKLFAESPWVSQPTYAKKVSHKLEYGLKNIAFGWTAAFTEPYKEEFRTDTNRKTWHAFMVGLSRGIFYTANGLIQTATFFVPVDFIDMGDGIQHPAITNNQPYGQQLVAERSLREYNGYGDHDKINSFPER